MQDNYALLLEVFHSIYRVIQTVVCTILAILEGEIHADVTKDEELRVTLSTLHPV